MKEHTYRAELKWTGNKGKGTIAYREYERTHVVKIDMKPVLELSSEPTFRGDPSKYNPEELLVSAISSCHMLWYLHLCAESGVIAVEYEDHATGIMEENDDGSGQFREVILRPRVKVTDPSMITTANSLHDKAHALCFIARSCNFPIRHEPDCYL